MSASQPVPLTGRFREAFSYAADKHQRQARKGSSVPYLSHLMAVTALVLEAGGDEDQAIAALLHDVPEDQGGRAALDEIRTKFGERVAEVVEACTDTFEEPKPEWRSRKQRYVDHLPQAPADAHLVSAADKLHNARAILSDYREAGEKLWPRFKRGRDEQLWYFDALIRAFRGSSRDERVRRIVDELERTVRELHALTTR